MSSKTLHTAQLSLLNMQLRLQQKEQGDGAGLSLSARPHMRRYRVGDVHARHYYLLWTGQTRIDGFYTNIPVRVQWVPTRASWSVVLLQKK